MWFLWTLSWLSALIQISFCALAIASGLYYLAELVEEFTVIAAKVIKLCTTVTLLIYIGLFLFEDFPLTMVMCGGLAQIFHFALLKSFPFFVATSAEFFAAIVMTLVNHFLAFQFFSNTYYPFPEVLSYFTICLWIVPFALFVSLSANENVLPTVNTSAGRPLLSDDNDVVSNYFMRKEKKRGLLAAFQGLLRPKKRLVGRCVK